jgi:hypothetical protein
MIFVSPYTEKKEIKIFLIYKNIQVGSGAKSCIRKGFLILYMRKCANFLQYMRTEEAVSHLLLCTRSLLISLYMRKIFFSFLSVYLSVYRMEEEGLRKLVAYEENKIIEKKTKKFEKEEQLRETKEKAKRNN